MKIIEILYLFVITTLITLFMIWGIESVKYKAVQNDSIIAETKQKRSHSVSETSFEQPALINKFEETPKEQIIEKTENHYHFDTLNKGLKFLGVALLSIFVTILLLKSFKSIRSLMVVRSAIRKSKKILSSFDNSVKNKEKYLAISQHIAEQVFINNIIISNQKDKNNIVNLILNTEKLKDRLRFMENSLFNSEKGNQIIQGAVL